MNLTQGAALTAGAFVVYGIGYYVGRADQYALDSAIITAQAEVINTGKEAAAMVAGMMANGFGMPSKEEKAAAEEVIV